MAFEFKFPDVGEGIHEGEIVRWRVKVGDEVKADQPLVEVETAKAIVELPSPQAGFVLGLVGKEGDVINVGDVLVALGKAGEKWEAKKKAPGVIGQIPTEDGVVLPPRRSEGKVNAGRNAPSQAPAHDDEKAPSREAGLRLEERVPLHGIRKEIAAAMTKSAMTIPHVTHMDEVDATALMALREAKKPQALTKNVKLTFLPFIVKAFCETLKKHPALNATFTDKEIIYKKYYNVGIAVDTPRGLMLPVIKDADKKDEFALAAEIADLAEKCRTEKISLAEISRATCAITNIGSVGGIFATPIIPFGMTANLGVMRIAEKPVVVAGKIEIRPMLSLALSYDHRVVDGAEAARAMNDLMQNLLSLK
jgi:pyruvate dehydrogenase E2 component (dihydrolipoamide acetyltransferase)